MSSAWGWTGIVKGHLAKSPGFPDTEDEIYMMPLERVLVQMRWLNQEADARDADNRMAEKEAERLRKEKEQQRRFTR